MSTYQYQNDIAKKLLVRDLFSVKNNKKYFGKYVTICVINPNRQTGTYLEEARFSVFE